MFRRKVTCLTVALTITIHLVSMFPSCRRVFPESSDVPIHLHLTWQKSNMSSAITVTWQTSNSSSGNTVFYDTVSRDGNPSLYKYSATGISHTYEGASGYLHDTELTGLTPNSTYYFVCGGAEGGYSGERSFRTAPTGSSHLRFVFGGDCRGNWTRRDEISRTMSKFNPSFVLLGGDFVTSGFNQNQWDNFFEGLHKYWIGTNNLTIPIVPCFGNHEENATNYYEQFALPRNEQWYSFNWGEYVHITILNSEAAASADQLIWLGNDLASHEHYPWKFVMFHRPLFSSSHHGSWIEGQESWCPLFDKYDVDIVFAAHDHNYERSKPINYTASKTDPQSSYSTGTMYVVSAGWGAPLYDSGFNWWTDYSSSVYNFVFVDVFANGTLKLQAKDVSGLTFDQVVVRETPAIPKFPFIIVLLLLMIITLLAVVLHREIRGKSPQGNVHLEP